MALEDPRRVETLRALVEGVQEIGLLSDRIGHLFADTQSLHPTDFRALSAIYRAERAGHPLTGRALASELQLSPAAVTYVVDRLAESGHVTREKDPHDGRRLVLRYAEPGREVAGRFFGPLAEAHSGALSTFGSDDLITAARVLDAVRETLSAFEARLRRVNDSPTE